jgi:hypothetical protein
MRIPVFELERVQSLYENTVEYNLTESGFHPLRLNELLTPDQLRELSETVLGYGQTNGSVPLRERIASLYQGQKAANVVVTNGSSEANFVACHTLLEPGDEVVMMVPNYMQIWGIVDEMGAIPRAFHLREREQWAPDLDELRDLVVDRTKMIVVCNPNNPTGYTLSDEEMREIVDLADSVGAWVLADEVYRGAELDGVESPSFVGLYDKVMVDWLDSYGNLFHFVPPKAGGMAFMHYDLEINSTELADWLRTEHSVLILAGDCYGMDRYFRVGVGAKKEYLIAGLERIRDAFRERFGV